MFFWRKEKKEKTKAVKSIVTESDPTYSYFLLLALSAGISSLGIIQNSEAVIIGGMLIGPFLAPLMALSLGFVTLSPKAIIRAFLSTLGSIALIVVVSMTLGYMIEAQIPINHIILRGDFSYVYLLVAFLSGAAASYLWIKPKKSANSAGVAISVSLIPPLCITGLTLSSDQYNIALESTTIFVANVIGILISSMVVFLLMDLIKFRALQEEKIKKDQNK